MLHVTNVVKMATYVEIVPKINNVDEAVLINVDVQLLGVEDKQHSL